MYNFVQKVAHSWALESNLGSRFRSLLVGVRRNLLDRNSKVGLAIWIYSRPGIVTGNTGTLDMVGSI